MVVEFKELLFLGRVKWLEEERSCVLWIFLIDEEIERKVYKMNFDLIKIIGVLKILYF